MKEGSGLLASEREEVWSKRLCGSDGGRFPVGSGGIGGDAMDPKEQLLQVTDLLSVLVDGTDAGQLGDETPCSDFHVRDLIGHFTLGRFLFAAGLSGDKSRGDELLGGMPEQLVPARLVTT